MRPQPERLAGSIRVFPAQARAGSVRDVNVTTLAIPVFILFMILERISYRFLPDPGEQGYGLWDSATSIGMGLGSIFIDAWAALGTGIVIVWCYEITPLRIPANVWWAWALVFVANDLSYYWSHRASHEIRILWAGHVVHHSSQRYNLSTALRQSWTGQGTFVFGIPLALAGASLSMVATVGGFNLLYQFFIHTERVNKLSGPLSSS